MIMDYGIIFRSLSVYLFLILAIRLAGRKELSQLSTTDLVFIILISNSVQNAMVGTDSSLMGGLLAAATLFLANYLFKIAIYLSPWFKKAVEGEPVLLVSDGKVNLENLHKMKLTMAELEEAIREHGVALADNVKLAVMEVDGNISVVSIDDKTLRRTYHRRKKTHKHFAGN
jgi:uncharacterized membrane protein YcaP (DUF421 family)